MNINQDTLTWLSGIMLCAPLILGVGCLVLGYFRRVNRSVSQWLGIVTVTVSGILLTISVRMMLAPVHLFPLQFSIKLAVIGFSVDFRIDSLSLFFVLLVNAIAFAVSWNDIAYLESQKDEPKARLQRPAVVHGLVNLFHFTMLLVPMVDNLVGIWIAIEMTTLFSAFLVANQGTRNAWEAAWKYLIITSTGIVVALLGTMLLANAIRYPAINIPLDPITKQPLDTVMDWSFLMGLAQKGQLEPDFVQFAFLFAVIGYGTKAGLAPMHTWLPDGHGEAPAPVSALLSGVLLKCALYAILRFYTLTNTALVGSTTFTSEILLALGLISLLVVTPLILKRDNPFKRVLAYHSVEHMGIITFGLGLGGPIALFGVVLHTLNHALTKSLMFLSFGNVMRRYEEAAKADGWEFKQETITGVLRSMPVTGGLLTLGGLALVGTPPFNIFLSEFIILWGAISRFWNKDLPGLPQFEDRVIIGAVILFVLSTTLIFYGLVRHLAKLVLHKMPNARRLKEEFRKDLFPLVCLFVFILLFGVWVIPPLSNLISNSVNIILGQF